MKTPQQTMIKRLDPDRVFGGIVLLALHEIDSLQAHAVAAIERMRVARAARNLSQLRREQRELLYRTGRRLREDHTIRRELWLGLLKDLGAGNR